MSLPHEFLHLDENENEACVFLQITINYFFTKISIKWAL